MGGGNILITRLNGMESAFTGQCDTLIIPHRDTPGVIATVTQALALYKVNIGNFKLTRPIKGDMAIMTIELDGQLDSGVVELLKKAAQCGRCGLPAGKLKGEHHEDCIRFHCRAGPPGGQRNDDHRPTGAGRAGRTAGPHQRAAAGRAG